MRHLGIFLGPTVFQGTSSWGISSQCLGIAFEVQFSVSKALGVTVFSFRKGVGDLGAESVLAQLEERTSRKFDRSEETMISERNFVETKNPLIIHLFDSV